MDSEYMNDLQHAFQQINHVPKYRSNRKQQKPKLIQPNNGIFYNGFNSAQYYMNLALNKQSINSNQTMNN